MPDLNTLTVTELKMMCKELGIDIPKGFKKADIIALLETPIETIEVEAEVIEDEPTELAVTYHAGEIDSNLDKLDQMMDAYLAQFEGWTPSADSDEDLESIKAVKKELKPILDGMEQRRKEVAAAYKKPLDDFMAKYKPIHAKGKAFYDSLTDKEREAKEAYQMFKQSELEEHYLGCVGILADNIPYNKIHDPRWLNKGVNTKKAMEEIDQKVEKIMGDIQGIKQMNLAYESDALAVYYMSLDFGEAIKRNTELEEAKRKAEETEAKTKEIKAESFDPMTMEQEHRPIQPQPEIPIAQDSPKTVLSQDESLYRFTIEIPRTTFITTINEAKALKRHLEILRIPASMTKSKDSMEV